MISKKWYSWCDEEDEEEDGGKKRKAILRAYEGEDMSDEHMSLKFSVIKLASDKNRSLFRLNDGWGERYFLVEGSEARQVAVKMPDVKAFNFETPLESYGKSEVEMWGWSDEAWDREICRLIFPNPDPDQKNGRTVIKEYNVPIGKINAEKRLVYAVVLEPGVMDAQGDYETEEDIEMACHAFNRGPQKVGLRHVKEAPKGVEIVESYIAPVDYILPDPWGDRQRIKKGSWIIVLYIGDDAIWEAVKRGEYAGVSIGGKGDRIPLAASATSSIKSLVEIQIPQAA